VKSISLKRFTCAETIVVWITANKPQLMKIYTKEYPNIKRQKPIKKQWHDEKQRKQNITLWNHKCFNYKRLVRTTTKPCKHRFHQRCNHDWNRDEKVILNYQKQFAKHLYNDEIFGFADKKPQWVAIKFISSQVKAKWKRNENCFRWTERFDSSLRMNHLWPASRSHW